MLSALVQEAFPPSWTSAGTLGCAAVGPANVSTAYFRFISTAYFRFISTACFRFISTAYFRFISTAYFRVISTAYFRFISIHLTSSSPSQQL
jgi:hypothetical protein